MLIAMPTGPRSAALANTIAALDDRLKRLVAGARVAIAESPDAPLAILEALVGPMRCAVLVADNAARFVLTNDAASRLTGYSREELRRLSMWQITPGVREREAESLWRAFLEQRWQSGEYRICQRGGNEIALAYVAAAHVLPGLHVSLLQAPDSIL
jgi:PAS domain S-box-containing protein